MDYRHLLDKVSYDHRRDVLVHTGDIISRGSHKGSMAILDFMTINNVTGVRGNNDQKVIEWKSWLDWFFTLHGAAEWLAGLESVWLEDHRKGHKLESWVKSRRQSSRGKDAIWWKHIPKGWIPFNDHYRIAKDLTKKQHTYLTSLPLKIHAPSAHTLVIHAGLLPYDVHYDYDHKRQPLAHIPHIRSLSTSHNRKTEALRNAQELAILLQVPQNTQPWVNMNMRSVLDDNTISKYVLSPRSAFLLLILWSGIPTRVLHGLGTGMSKCLCVMAFTQEKLACTSRTLIQYPLHPTV